MQENFNYKEYRNNLAEQIKSEDNKDKRKEILKEAKETEKYKLAHNLHLENATNRKNFLIEKGLEEEVVVFDRVVELAEVIKEAGGVTYLVGGSVRDEIMGIDPKDYDVEVFGIEQEELIELARKHGGVKEVGESYNIIKLKVGKAEIDISTPRREKKVGNGYKGFEVEVDSQMSIREAASRRDFTINAVYKNILTGEIIDHYGGVDDIENKVLRITNSERFKEDPLRVLRGIQFVGRFDLSVDKETEEEMKEMCGELHYLSKERIKDEWIKLLIKSEKPSLGLEVAKKWGVLKELYPELDILQNIPQDEEWHPERDVWNHTILTVDAMRTTIKEEDFSEKEEISMMLAALCHDLGKIETTNEVNGRIRALGHEEAGEEPTKNLLEKIGVEDKLIIKTVIGLVREHLKPLIFYSEFKKGQKVTDGAFRKLATRIHPATMKQLMIIAKADYYGRGHPLERDNFEPEEWFLSKINELDIESKKAEPIISGKDLIELGFKPSHFFGDIIRIADKMNEEGYSREDILQSIEELKNEKVELEEIINYLNNER